MRVFRVLLPALTLPGLVFGQQLAKLDDTGDRRSANDASVVTRTDARTLTLTIPAPRGIITDRFGKPLAQNRVGYQFGIQFDHFEKPVDAEVIAWARAQDFPDPRSPNTAQPLLAKSIST